MLEIEPISCEYPVIREEGDSQQCDCDPSFFLRMGNTTYYLCKDHKDALDKDKYLIFGLLEDAYSLMDNDAREWIKDNVN